MFQTKWVGVMMLTLGSWLTILAAENRSPVQLAIVGLVHDHVWGMLPALEGRADITLAGIVEPDPELCRQIAQRFHLKPELFYPSLEALRAARKIEGVALFPSPFDHRRWVETCAPLGLPVM